MKSAEYVARVRRWWTAAQQEGATHLVVLYNVADREYTVINITEYMEVRDVLDGPDNLILIVEEVYSLRLNFDSQVANNKAWNPD
jgi:hypothetical protein